MIKDKMQQAKSQLVSDSAEINTVSILGWLVIGLIIVLTVGTMIRKAVVAKGKDVADSIDQSNDIINGKGGDTGKWINDEGGQWTPSHSGSGKYSQFTATPSSIS